LEPPETEDPHNPDEEEDPNELRPKIENELQWYEVEPAP
jgi:hypothetical protein